MAMRQFTTSVEEVAKEVADNISKPKDNAILLISGTDTDEGIRQRIYCNNPGKVAGTLYSWAVNTGDFAMIREILQQMKNIIVTTEDLIERDLRRQGRKN